MLTGAASLIMVAVSGLSTCGSCSLCEAWFTTCAAWADLVRDDDGLCEDCRIVEESAKER